MDAYTGFAQVYDLFMDNVPYEDWANYLENLLKQHHIEGGTVVDLGCGTGTLTRQMADKGYDLIGVDNSPEMLCQARQGEASGKDILYLMQDMQNLELLGEVRAVYSACDCMNYLLEKDELLEVFRRVHIYLEKDGLFVFDMNTPYKYRELLGENTIAESREEGSFIWENYFDEAEGLNEYCLTLFVPEEKDLYRRYEEVHYQRCYEITEIEELLKKAGWGKCQVFDAYTGQPIKEDSERALFVVTKA